MKNMKRVLSILLSIVFLVVVAFGSGVFATNPQVDGSVQLTALGQSITIPTLTVQDVGIVNLKNGNNYLFPGLAPLTAYGESNTILVVSDDGEIDGLNGVMGDTCFFDMDEGMKVQITIYKDPVYLNDANNPVFDITFGNQALGLGSGAYNLNVKKPNNPMIAFKVPTTILDNGVEISKTPSFGPNTIDAAISTIHLLEPGEYLFKTTNITGVDGLVASGFTWTQ